ncbi:MAG: hypothetical protein P8P74_10560 [Crocinitomicaceae bacterium]|nr:hypothetical protein [Crocinitomicaceae bacterium]
MILAGFTFDSTTVIYILCVTLGILVVAIGYRQLLRYLGKGTPPKEDYCVLYSLEKSPAQGELEFYFTSEMPKSVTMNILDAEMNFVTEVSTIDCHKGGNIIRYDSTQIANGNYFYCLQTANQKTMKKMRIKNG